MALDPILGRFLESPRRRGHAFGSHTWRHGSFRKDEAGGKVRYRLMDGSQTTLDAAQICAELKAPDTRFAELTGRKLDALWRAPGGRTTAQHPEGRRSLRLPSRPLGAAGFLGDELPTSFPTKPCSSAPSPASRRRHPDGPPGHLVPQGSLRAHARSADRGLKDRGFCFATIPNR